MPRGRSSIVLTLPVDLNPPPSTKELAAFLEIGTGEILEALEARERRRPLGLDAPIRGMLESKIKEAE